MPNPLIDERHVDFLIHDVLDVGALCRWPAFAAHSPEAFDQVLATTRQVARELLFPAYRDMDAEPPRYDQGDVRVHPKLREIYPALVDLGILTATRPEAVGGLQLPFTIASAASAWLMAANLGAYGFAGLTSAAAHLLEAFGSDHLQRTFMAPMYAGRWTGTMALTEPQAGSSLADVRTRARPGPDGTWLVDGAKVFISGGEQDFTENIVHLTLARLEGAPAGLKGVSLLAIPKRRPEGDRLVDNDVRCTGVFHKLGWRGIPSVGLAFGEAGDCRGWLVGEPNRGISYMFQMMNEARLMVGLNGIATASVAYHESLDYARGRPQGRRHGQRDPASPQVPIIEHADVRRMLLRQKAIVGGGLALLLRSSLLADTAAHAPDEAQRARAALLLDLLTPVAKSFPAEFGFQSNALAVQIHGGYGYTSEYLPEAWLRDQKLNSIHEGTTGIQALDLLGRKAMQQGGAAVAALVEEVHATLARGRSAGLRSDWLDAVEQALSHVVAATQAAGARGLEGDVEGMLAHATSYLEAMSITCVAWQWLEQVIAARRNVRGVLRPEFVDGLERAAHFWIVTDLPRVASLCALVVSGDDAFTTLSDAAF